MFPFFFYFRGIESFWKKKEEKKEYYNQPVWPPTQVKKRKKRDTLSLAVASACGCWLGIVALGCVVYPGGGLYSHFSAAAHDFPGNCFFLEQHLHSDSGSDQVMNVPCAEKI